MKKSTNIKILIPVVAVIWGLLIYKIIDAFHPEEPTTTSIASTTFLAPLIKERDTFSLLPVERDPFLGTLYNPIKTQPNATKKILPKQEKAPWPQLTYLGSVKDKNSETTVFIIQLNGQQHIVKKGETIGEVKLLKGTAENIIITYNGSKREFSKM